MSAPLERLAATLRAQGGLLAGAALDAPPGAPALHGPLAARGPRAAGDPERYELLVEAIREGYLLHYGTPRVVDPSDPDLALLAGDQLYALGLAELAALGDLDAVGELADVISLAAQAHAGADPELADAVWEAGAVAVGWGPGEPHRAAKARARREAGAGGAAGAADALRAAARERRDGA
jgi:hypothetical protein